MTSEKSSLIRDGFPKVRRVVRRNGTVAYRVDCRTKGWLGQQTYEFATRNEALEKARVIAKDAETQGVGVTSASLHLAHSDEYAELTQKLAPHGKTIRDAVDYYLQHLEENRLREGSLRVTELLDQWNTAKQDPSQNLRQHTRKGIRWWSRRLAKEFPKHRIRELTVEVVKKHHDRFRQSDGKPASPNHRRDFLSHLSQFLNWCLQNGHLESNPVNRIKKPLKQTPDAEFLSLRQCERLVSVLNRPEFKPLRGKIAIGLFAGIRNAEMERLEWSRDFNWDQKEIVVVSSRSKTKRGRSVPIAPVLKAWLDIADTTTSRVGDVPQRMMDRFRKQVGFRIPPNALRHTFASYWGAVNDSKTALAKIMGNSEEVAERHYLRLASKKDAEEFWRLYPHSETLGQFFEVNPPV